MSVEAAAARTRLAQGAPDIDVSIVVPLFNEAENVLPLAHRIGAALDSLPRGGEAILVNDGSTDGTEAALTRAALGDGRIRIINLACNAGQTAALMAGFAHARGRVIVALDGDLQNDPADIPRLVAKIDEGYDVVSGVREHRRDKFLSRRLPSLIANRVISAASGVRLRDYGCSLKAYRREVIQQVKLYGEMHRFIPIYAAWQGARITELAVRHHARISGRSKYGLSRIAKVLLDLCVVIFLDRFRTKPIYVFGGCGLLGMACGVFSLALAVYWRIADGTSLIQTPMPLLAVITFALGVVSILMGLLAEILVRTWYESQNRPVYLLKSRLNF